MKEHPILFKGDMVRAILEGRKTQTRRIIKPQPYTIIGRDQYGEIDSFDVWRYGTKKEDFPTVKRSPYGQVGDRLWVRETWQVHFDDEIPVDRFRGPQHTMGIPSRPDRKSYVFYRADGELNHPVYGNGHWCSPIHLNRKYSRLTLEIIKIRIERLHEITPYDCIAEGISPLTQWELDTDAEGKKWEEYRSLWESINGEGSWNANPWVWVITFKVVS